MIIWNWIFPGIVLKQIIIGLNIGLNFLFLNHNNLPILFLNLLLFIWMNLLLSLSFEAWMWPLLNILILLILVDLLIILSIFLLQNLLLIFFLLRLLLCASYSHHFWSDSIIAKCVFLKHHGGHSFSRILMTLGIQMSLIHTICITIKWVF